MYGPPRVAKRQVERPYICGICGKKTQLVNAHLKIKGWLGKSHNKPLGATFTKDGVIIQLKISLIGFNTYKSRQKQMPPLEIT